MKELCAEFHQTAQLSEQAPDNAWQIHLALRDQEQRILGELSQLEIHTLLECTMVLDAAARYAEAPLREHAPEAAAVLAVALEYLRNRAIEAD